jgi:hypothetical protein
MPGPGRTPTVSQVPREIWDLGLKRYMMKTDSFYQRRKYGFCRFKHTQYWGDLFYLKWEIMPGTKSTKRKHNKNQQEEQVVQLRCILAFPSVPLLPGLMGPCSRGTICPITDRGRNWGVKFIKQLLYHGYVQVSDRSTTWTLTGQTRANHSMG